jgi:hypothetical protein
LTPALARRLIAFHAAVVLAGLLSSPAACLAALFVSLLALARYLAMAAFASSLGSAGLARSALLAGAWLVAGLALVVAVAATARLARPCLPWALAAALAGPAAFIAESLLSGLRQLGAARERSAE